VPQVILRQPGKAIEVASDVLKTTALSSLVAGQHVLPAEAEQTYRQELALFAKMLHQRHYVSGCDGNLSVRLDGQRVLTTPTRMSKALLKPEDMVIVDLEGRSLEGVLAPSSEIGMHLTIYQARADVSGIVHAHPIVATGFACAGMDLSEPVCSELVLTLGRIPLAPFAQPGTPALSQCLRPFIKDHNAILMQGHGVVAYGETLSQAYLNMETVEHSAAIAMVMKLLGAKTTLNLEQVNGLVELRKKSRNRS
jgi:L-fuculose-phosphate aldolase